MSNKILLKRSAVANAIPSLASVSFGELALNYRDGKLYTKITDGIDDEIFELTQNQLITLGGNVTGSGISNITVSLNAAQTNITSVGNLISLNVDGVLNGSNVSLTGNLTATGNIQGEYLIANNAVVGNVSFSDITTGNITATGFANITGNVLGGNIITVGNVDATGNVAGNFFIGNGRFLSGIDTTLISNGATEVRTYENGNVAFTINGVANVVLVTPNGITVVGNTDSGNVSATTATLSTANVSGNVNSGNVNTTLVTATTANVSGNVNSGNVNTGFASVTGNVNSGNVNTTLVTTTTANVSGNVNSGNVNTGFISVTGDANIGGNITTGSGSGGNITGANVVSANTFTAAANVNSAGATVTGNITAGNIATSGQFNAGAISSASTITAVGNITGANLNTTGLTNTGALLATGNANVGNLGTAGQVIATGNITGGNVNTVGAVNAVGNVNGSNLNVTANVNGGNLIATANVNGGNVNTNKLSTLSGDLMITTGATNGNVYLEPTGSGNVIVNNSFVNGLQNPIQAQDAATKQYVDDAVSTGITIHDPVQLLAGSNLNGTYAQGGTTATVTDTIAGNTVVFSSAINPQVNDQLWFANSFNGILGNTPYFVVSAPNTSAAVLTRTYSGEPVSDITSGSSLTQSVRINSGQGATLTNAGANAALVIDGVTTQVGFRVLLESQANAVTNGVYDVTTVGDGSTAWVLTRSADMNTYIPDNILGLDAGDYFYVQLGNSFAGQSHVMTAPIGPTIIGLANLVFTEFSASQVYTANTSAGLVLVGTQFNAKVDNDTTAFDGLGNIIVKAGANLVTPNIGAASGTSLSLTGNVDSGNVNVAANVVATGNVFGDYLIANSAIVGNVSFTDINTGNITATGFANITGNVIGGNLVTAGLTDTATLRVINNANVGNLGTAGFVVATGNIAGGNLVTTGVVDSNTLVASGNANVGNLSTAGQVTATGNITGGNVNTVGVVNAGSVTATTTIDALGNITGANLTTAGLTNTGTLSVNANANVGNLGTAGQITATGNITGGNLVTAGQVTATGNITGGNIISVGNASVTGNAAVGGILTDNYYYANGTPVDFEQPAGSNTQVQFNFDGDFGASSNFTFDSDTNILTVTGNVDATTLNATTANITGNVNSGNVNTVKITASGNITGANIDTAGIVNSATLSVLGNANVGNLGTAGLIVATGNITGGNLVTAGAVDTNTLIASGNANVGNLGTAGLIVATGNITGGNIITTGIGAIATLTVSTLANITATTAATSNITGALTVAGGVGIGGNLYAGDMYSNGDLVLTDQSTIDGGLY